MIPALVVGTVLAIAVLAYVLYPVFFPPPFRARLRARVPSRSDDGDLAVVALREIEFDRATGKLSDVDYAQLRARYVDEAVSEMRRADVGHLPGMQPSGTSDEAGIDDPVEAAIRAYRATYSTCGTCGPRLEADAVYCSECGRFLPGKCDACGSPVMPAGARYCTECGTRLAA